MRKATVYIIAMLLFFLPVVVYAEFVATEDFVGNISLFPGMEMKFGKWFLKDAGVFEGTQWTERGNGTVISIRKLGQLKTVEFSGNLQTDQSVSVGSLGYSVHEVYSGIEKVDGGVFEGNKTIERNGITTELWISKIGKLRTDTYEGALRSEEVRADHAPVSYIQWYSGIEKVDGGVFEGNKTVERNGTTTELRISKVGKLRTDVFEGALRSEEVTAENGLVTSIKWYTGIEKTDDGVFEGNKTVERNGNTGEQRITKKGAVKSASFTGMFQLQEVAQQNGQVASTSVFSGNWTYSPTLKFIGWLLLRRNFNGQVVVTDRRIQAK